MPLLSRFHETRILLTADELDVFTLLEKDAMSALEIVDPLKAALRGGA